jgi:hypothetical protein
MPFWPFHNGGSNMVSFRRFLPSARPARPKQRDFSKADLRHHWPDQLLSIAMRVEVMKTPIYHHQSSGTGLTGIPMEQVKKLAEGKKRLFSNCLSEASFAKKSFFKFFCAAESLNCCAALIFLGTFFHQGKKVQADKKLAINYLR